ncbi:hypothetical protein O181_106483 [Austropuccinia psidii MF-1]|uniref:RNase H type-1 domain-containing protein n=1 Tax=Austropuccinia psidii MF-1 TaxID=1389203 RepID=A0A9Q3JP38_9BASI|nr:hypothetical protein [Austropuccinia psidii MF-1]
MIKLFPITPGNKVHPVYNIGEGKDTARKENQSFLCRLKPRNFLIFSDGSDIPNKGKGSEAIIEWENMIASKHIPPSRKATSYETELVGLILAMEAARKVMNKRSIRKEELGTIRILSNKQEALKK